MNRKPFPFLIGLIGTWTLSVAHADTSTFQPTAANNNYHDAFLRNDYPTTSLSGQDYGYLMNKLNGSYIGSYAVQFDGLTPYIGGNVTVTAAVLTVGIVSVSETDTHTPSLDVYALTQSFVNGATWNSRGGSLGNWTTPGGTVGATPAASIVPPESPQPPWVGGALHWDVTAVVSNWVAGGSPDDGFLIRWSANTNNYDRIFNMAGSGAYDGGIYNPTLTIYTVPEPSALALLSLALAGFASLPGFRARHGGS